MIKSCLAFIAITLVQGSPPPPPPPKNVPPVGDVPIDSYTLAIFVIALLVGIFIVLKNTSRKAI